MSANISNFQQTLFQARFLDKAGLTKYTCPRNSAFRPLLPLVLVCVLACSLFVAPHAYAQIRSATITGIVTDPKGAVVVDAQVTVTNTATRVEYTTKTTAAGLYTVPYLE